MITTIESLSVYELAGSHCAMNNVCLLHFENAKWATFDDAQKAACLAALEDYVPDDIISIIDGERDCAIEYGSEEVAVLNASEWFPPVSAYENADHYFRALVFDNNGNSVFENVETGD